LASLDLGGVFVIRFGRGVGDGKLKGYEKMKYDYEWIAVEYMVLDIESSLISDRTGSYIPCISYYSFQSLSAAETN
jgi:hypothetical protein